MSCFLFLFLVVVAYSQNKTGYNLVDSANVANVSAYQSVISNVGNAHAFTQTGISTTKNAIPYTAWQRMFGQAYSLPDSVIVTGYGDPNSQLTRLGIQLRTNGDTVNFSGTSLQILQAKAQVQRISFLLYKNSSQTTFNQLRFYASFEQNVVGNMKFYIVKIEIYSGGTYTVIDDGSGTGTGLLPPPSVLYYPQNGAVDVPVDTVFRWSSVSGATGYSFNLDGNISIVSDTFKTVTGMSYGAGHTWSVATINSAGTGSYSSIATFTTVSAPIVAPSKPELVSPLNNAIDVPVSETLKWRSSTGAVTYKLLIYTSTDTLISQVLSDTAYLAGSLSTNTQYWWNVIAQNSVANVSSDTWTFTTISSGNPPLPTTLIAPINGATGVTNPVNFSWNSSTGATMYRIIVTKTIGNIIVADETVTSTAFVKQLLDTTQYEWKVSSGNAYGFSGFSQVWSFTTSPPVVGLQVPVVAYPQDGATGLDINFTAVITSVTNATSYDLQLIKDTVMMTTYSSTSTSFVISGLSYSTLYKLRARAKNSSQTSDWGPLSSFTTKPAQVTVQRPTLLSPKNGSTGVSPNVRFAWLVNGQPDSLRFQLFEGGNVVIDLKFPASITSYDSPMLKYLTTYFWRMLGIKSGVSSDWTDLFSFTTMSAPIILQAPALLSPPNNSVVHTLNPTLSWGSVQGAGAYVLQVSNSSKFETFFQTSTNITSFELPNSYTHDGFTYYWRVRAVKGNEMSNWSEVWNFLILITTNVERIEGIPTSYSLSQNYPNPFNPSTVIDFSVPRESHVILKIYDITGREVKTLLEGDLPVGRYKATFDASRLASGIYIYRVIAGTFVETKKMVLMK